MAKYRPPPDSLRRLVPPPHVNPTPPEPPPEPERKAPPPEPPPVFHDELLPRDGQRSMYELIDTTPPVRLEDAGRAGINDRLAALPPLPYMPGIKGPHGRG